MRVANNLVQDIKQRVPASLRPPLRAVWRTTRTIFEWPLVRRQNQKLKIANNRLKARADKAQAALARARFGGVGSEVQPLWLKHFDNAFSFSAWVAGELGDETIDVCMVHDSLALEAARNLQRATGCKLVFDAVEFPEYLERYYKGAGENAIEAASEHLMHLHERSILDTLDGLMVGTKGVAKWYDDHGAYPRAHVVRNCLDFENLSGNREIRDDCGLKPGDRLILYPNTVFPGCGIEHVIDALTELEPNVNLAIMGVLGRGIEKPLMEQVARLGLTKRVHVLPLRHPRTLIDYRSGADLAAIPLDPEHPNHKTCLPNRVFESIMSRLPLVISELPYIREVVEEFDCGKVAHRYDGASFAVALRQVLDNLPHYKASAQTAAEALSWRNERERFLAAMEPAVQGRQGLNIVCIANKRLTTNRRVFRHTRTLAEAGHSVKLLALYGPVDELRDPRIDYRQMNVRDPMLDRLTDG